MSSADRYTLETPENVEVEFELAGLGSRFCAMLIDGLLIWLLVFALIMLAILLQIGILTAMLPLGPGAGGWAGWPLAVVWAIVAALLFGGYFVFFEAVMRGQTPGKKAMKIRVIRDDGTPVTLNEVLVRNILRLVDFLPVLYGLGGLVMFLNPLYKRLGDLAAGTIVVKEGQLDYRARADKKQPLGPVAVGVANAELAPEERRVLTGFLQRRVELLPKARYELAERLARPLYEKYGGHYGDAEGYIERLVEGRHYES
jgi:uncharacterized RDD family membrane protein YckC